MSRQCIRRSRPRFETYQFQCERLEPRNLLAAVQISGFVFEDVERDGFQRDDPGIAGFQVVLFQDPAQSGELDYITEVHTRSSGRFQFSIEENGSYFLTWQVDDFDGFGLGAPEYRFQVQDGQVFSPDGTPLPSDQFHFAFGHPLTIAGTKWLDRNRNGQREPEEPGLYGWEVFVDTNSNGRLDDHESTAITDWSGEFEIGGLDPGEYTIKEVNQVDWIQTFPESSFLPSTLLSLDTAESKHLITSIEVADIDNDNDIDLIATSERLAPSETQPILGVVTLFLNDGSGVFSTHSLGNVGIRPRSIEIDDLNNDGLLDMVVTDVGLGSPDQNAIFAVMNTGNNVFRKTRIDDQVHGPIDLKTADLDGDEQVDILVSGWRDRTLAILWNDQGTFSNRTTFAAPDAPVSVAIGHVDSDATLDFATSNFSDRGTTEIAWFLNQGDRNFERRTINLANLTPDSSSVLLEDVDGDLWIDLTVARFLEDRIEFRSGLGDGTFGEPISYSFPFQSRPNSLTVGTVTPRSGQNLIVSLSERDSVAMMDVSLHEISMLQEIPVHRSPVSQRFTELNGDALPDLVSADLLDGVTVQLSRSPSHVRRIDYGDEVTDVDFGNAPRYETSIEGTLFHDVNYNGIRDRYSIDGSDIILLVDVTPSLAQGGSDALDKQLTAIEHLNAELYQRRAFDTRLSILPFDVQLESEAGFTQIMPMDPDEFGPLLREQFKTEEEGGTNLTNALSGVIEFLDKSFPKPIETNVFVALLSDGSPSQGNDRAALRADVQSFFEFRNPRTYEPIVSDLRAFSVPGKQEPPLPEHCHRDNLPCMPTSLEVISGFPNEYTLTEEQFNVVDLGDPNILASIYANESLSLLEPGVPGIDVTLSGRVTSIYPSRPDDPETDNDESGQFVFYNLPPDNYEVAADLSGTNWTFTTSQDEVEIRSDRISAQFDIGLRNASWQIDSRSSPLDVDRNGVITAFDALAIINYLNNQNVESEFQLDVNDDGQVTAIDALRVINAIDSISNAARANPVPPENDLVWRHTSFDISDELESDGFLLTIQRSSLPIDEIDFIMQRLVPGLLSDASSQANE